MSVWKSKDKLSWAALFLGAFALGLSLYSTAAPSMRDGDMSSPSFIFSLSSLVIPGDPVSEPTNSPVPGFLLTDRNKRLVIYIASGILALATLATSFAARLLGQHSLGYSAGLLASASAISLINVFLFLGFVAAAAAILLVDRLRRIHA